MKRKRPAPEEIVGKLRQLDVLAAQGRSIAEAVRAVGTTEVTYYETYARRGDFIILTYVEHHSRMLLVDRCVL